jgi:hypothetical protein
MVTAGLLVSPREAKAQAQYEWTWQNPLPQGNTLDGVSALDENNVWAVGDSGTILHWNGTSWSAQASGTTNWLTSTGHLADGQ